MSIDFFSGPDAKSALELIGAERYDEIIQSLEDQLSDRAEFSSKFRAYVYVLLIADEIDRLPEAINCWEALVLEDQSSVRLSAAILEVLDRRNDSQELITRFSHMGGTTGDLLTECAFVASVSGKPDLQMDFLHKRAVLPDVDRNDALLKYLRVCLQYNEIDRAQAIRALVDLRKVRGQHIIATLDAADGNQTEVLDRVHSWLADPNANPKLFGLIENLWIEAGIPELFDPMRRAAWCWRHEPGVVGRALAYHLIGMKGVNPGNLPVADELTINPDNHLDIIEALIDHGDVTTADHILQKTEQLTSSRNKNRRLAFGSLISSLRSLPTRREIVVDNPNLDWILSKPADPGKLCIFFTGLNGRSGVGGIRIIDRFLASYGYQVLYVRDFNRLAYAKGILSRGPNQSDALEALSRVIHSSGASDPIFFGASLGTAGAIEHGLKLKVQRIIAFGYHSRIKSNDRWRIGDSRAPLVNFREGSWTSAPKFSLPEQLERSDHEFKIDVVFERSNLVDTFYARSLQNLRGLRLHPMSNSMSHNCLRSAMIDGTLERFF